MDSNQTKEVIYHTTDTGVEVKIEELKLHVKKQQLELKDGTNIMGLIVFCTVFGIILGQLGPDGKCDESMIQNHHLPDFIIPPFFWF